MKTQNVGFNQSFGSVYLPKNKKTTQWIADYNKVRDYESILPVDSKLSLEDILSSDDSQRSLIRRNDFTVQGKGKFYKIVGRGLGDEIDFLSNYNDEFAGGRVVPDHPAVGIYEAVSRYSEITTDDIKDAVKRKRLSAGDVKQSLVGGIINDYMILSKKVQEFQGAGLIKKGDLPKALKNIF